MPRHDVPLFVVESIVIAGLFGVVVRLSRPTRRRLIGALVGGGVVGLVVQPTVEAMLAPLNLYRFEDRATHQALVFYPQLALAMSLIALVVWRLQRRYGAEVLVVVAIIAMVFLPIRDYVFNSRTRWIEYGSGAWPWVLDSIGNSVAFLLPVGIMRLVAGAPGSVD